MHFPIVFGISYLVVLTATVSTPYEVTEFRWLKNDKGEVLCATSPPNKTVTAVESRAQCAVLCKPTCGPTTCQNVNYWTNARRCELFDYLPCSYAVQQDCANYQVTANKFWSFQNHTHSSYDDNQVNSFQRYFRLIYSFCDILFSQLYRYTTLSTISRRLSYSVSPQQLISS